MDQSDKQQAEALALQILSLAQSQLTLELRFMSRAISRMPPVIKTNARISTDGTNLYIDPQHILSLFQMRSSLPAHHLLHLILHCIFRHNLVSTRIDPALWDLSCDIAVEDTIESLHLRAAGDPRAEKRTVFLNECRADLGVVTAEKLYPWLRDRKLSNEDFLVLKRDFLADDHSLWYTSATGKNLSQDSEEIWRQVAVRMKNELELNAGNTSGAMLQQLKQMSGKRRDYSAFLRNFCQLTEQLRLSDEEFDQNYYTYGLKLYGDIPLIEPLEYRENQGIRQFVIAIDTSGSVKGEAVQAFVQKTWEILMDHEHFSDSVEVHIIQCDNRIREDAVIRSRQDFQQYLAGCSVKGLGGTDFRPVFDYVDALQKRGELTHLQGLIYFTDGKGSFPDAAPPYRTAFVLRECEGTEIEVPPWAMSMSLNQEEIRSFVKAAPHAD